MITNIFFDFDGVLCESVAVKTEAFRQLYAPYGEEVADAVVTYHKANGGVSRYDKIRHYHKALLHTDITDGELAIWAHRFSELAMAGVAAAPEVHGAIDFLRENKDRYTYWVITATPTPEIHAILKAKGWEGYFAGAYGAPEKKSYWVKHILDTRKLHADEVVFVGDALADKEAADDNGIQFILRHTDENKILFPRYTGEGIRDLTELELTLNGL